MTSTDKKKQNSVPSAPGTPTSRLARSALTSRQLLAQASQGSIIQESSEAPSSPLTMGTTGGLTATDEFAGELPPPPSSPALSYGDILRDLEESSGKFAGKGLRQQEQVPSKKRKHKSLLSIN